MNKRRKIICALGASTLVAPLSSFAQQQGKIYRIGFLDAVTAIKRAAPIDNFRTGMRELGYAEGKNILIEFRFAEGKYDRLAGLAAELVRSKVDVIVAIGTPCSIAAKQATSTIPIVMVSVGDPVVAGLVASLARPGGNVTGLASLSAEINLKRFELLREALPRAKQVAIVINPGNSSNANSLKSAETAARSLKMDLQKFEVRNLDELKSAFATMAKKGAGAVVVPQDSMFAANYEAIAILAETHRIPAFGPAEFAEAGGLTGSGPSQLGLYRRAAYYIDKILKGAKPADLPVEQPAKFDLIVNLKTAKALGIKIPQSILVRADKLIE